MKVTERTYLAPYSQTIGSQLEDLLNRFDFSENNGRFDYLTKASAVYSSNIEGNSVDLNSYMNYELSQEKSKPGKEIEEIENLVGAYGFAQKNTLTEANLLHCHKMFSETFLIKSKRGAYRIEPVGMFGKTGMAYLAVEPELVGKEMETFFKGVAELLSAPLTTRRGLLFCRPAPPTLCPYSSLQGRQRTSGTAAGKMVPGGKTWRTPLEDSIGAVL